MSSNLSSPAILINDRNISASERTNFANTFGCLSNSCSTTTTVDTSSSCEDIIRTDFTKNENVAYSLQPRLIPSVWKDQSTDMCLFDAYLVHGTDWSAIATFMCQRLPITITAKECVRRWDECIVPMLQTSYHTPQWSAADKTPPTSSKSGVVEVEHAQDGNSTQAVVTLRDRVEGWADRPFNEPHPTAATVDSWDNHSRPPTVSSSALTAEKRGRGRPKKIVEPVILREVQPTSEQAERYCREPAPMKFREYNDCVGESLLASEDEEEKEERRTVARGGTNTWTDAQLQRLTEAVERYGHQWNLVSKHVGGSKTREQCRMRNRVRVGATPPAAQQTEGRQRAVNMKVNGKFAGTYFPQQVGAVRDRPPDPRWLCAPRDSGCKVTTAAATRTMRRTG